jgi:dihydrofolate reductase
MEFWQPIVKNPSGNPAMDDFALAIDKIPKIVFSHTLQKLEWDTARLAKQGLKEEILSLKAQTGKDLFIGCPSLIVQAINLNLLDELQLCVHPVLAGKGIPLFKNLQPGVELTLLKTKTFDSGAVILYYAPTTVAQD